MRTLQWEISPQSGTAAARKVKLCSSRLRGGGAEAGFPTLFNLVFSQGTYLEKVRFG